MIEPKVLTLREVFGLFGLFFKPEKSFIWLGIIYGVGISLLSLATPISVQMLINTVAFTGLATPLIVLSLTLFGLLLAAGLLNALRVHLMEIFGRRFYSRMVSEIALRSIYAQNPFFADDGRGPLFNRYFDIVIVQKNVPILIVGAFTILLQAAVGFTLTSFYHPLFFAFNIGVILSIWAVWLIWGRGAVRTGINLSHKKHAAAAWLEGLGASNGYYKSERHVAHALHRTDEVTGDYVNEHRSHFRYFFSQMIGFFIIYAAASAALLGLGGWLVIQGQLTLGQLVAAELVLSAVYFGISQLGSYVTYFYDLCAALEELSLFYDLDQEEPRGDEDVVLADASLECIDVRGEARDREALFNFALPSGKRIMASASDHGIQRLFTNLLKRHDAPRGGFITIGGVDIMAGEAHKLRRYVMVLDRSTIVEMTARDYLQLCAADASAQDILQAIKTVGLQKTFAQFDEGLDEHLGSTGWPLSIVETLQLKLAAATIAKPKVLVLTQLFDALPEPYLVAALDKICGNSETTVVYFSNRRKPLNFNLFLHLRHKEQTLMDDFAHFAQAAYPDGQAIAIAPAAALDGPAETKRQEA